MNIFPRDINLLPPKEKTAHPVLARLSPFIVPAMAILLLLAAVAIPPLITHGQKSREAFLDSEIRKYADIQQEISSIEIQMQQTQAVLQELELFEQTDITGAVYSQVLSAAPEGLVLEEFVIHPLEIEIKGSATGTKLIADFADKLRGSFPAVKVIDVTWAEGTWRFSITARQMEETP